jgi:hypothetical protein
VRHPRHPFAAPPAARRGGLADHPRVFGALLRLTHSLASECFIHADHLNAPEVVV